MPLISSSSSAMKKSMNLLGMDFSSLFFSLLITIFSTISFSSSSSVTPQISYSDHCSSIVPESTPTVRDFSAVQSLRGTTTFFTGGDSILGNNRSYERYLSFRTTRNSYSTNQKGVYKFEAYMTFRSSGLYYSTSNDSNSESTYGSTYTNRTRNRRTGPLRFRLNGFWSESSGKLCMVGSALWYSAQGKTLNLEAVLKLNYIITENLTILNSLFNGTLESLSASGDSNYFQPISILGFSRSDIYKYTLNSTELGGGCSGGIGFPQKFSLSLGEGSVCSILSSRYDTFELEYNRECSNSSSTKNKNCTPFSGNIDYLPLVMSMNAIQCSNEEQKLRYMIDFSNSSYLGYYGLFNPNTTLIGEGSWDEKKNRLCISACRILDVSDSWGNARVGDCSIRLSLMFPTIWSIRNTSTMVGQIWTTKSENKSGYFETITFRSSSRMINVPGLKYEYTETNRVRKSCPTKKPGKNKGVNYPSGYSSDMRFDMSITDSKAQFGWGYAVPISTDHQLFEEYPGEISRSWSPDMEFDGSYTVASSPIAEAKTGHTGPMNISYKISFNPPAGVKANISMNPFGQVEISAEGIYDPDTGHLCMVGCRKLSSSSRIDYVDCEILVNFQFSPMNSKNGGVIKGSIESMRKRSDSLHFEHFNITSNSFYATEAKQSIWRMDLEIIMVLISNTLACVFVGLQILYVKKNPNVLPSNSIGMLVILTLGHMVPLVLNFEALFLGNRNRQDVLHGSGGWLEVNEVIVRVVTMVAFLLQIRLLQVAWPSQLAEGNQKGLWAAEIKALFVSFPTYIIGGLIALLVNMKKNSYGIGYEQHPLWEVFRSYAGLIVDGFLFPQILLNIFQSSREKALSHSFYIGTTSVRVLPHAYDLYRTHNYVPQPFNGSYIYANPTADFYSTAWDVIIPIGGVVFAVIIFLQQRYGGRAIVPRKFIELGGYEKVPVVSS